MISMTSFVIESSHPGGTRVFTTAADLVAPIANIHLIFALESDTPNIPGEIDVLLEWIQRGTKKRSRMAIGQAFGALGVEPQLTTFDSSIAFSVQALDAIRDPICALAAEMLFTPAFDEDELVRVLAEYDEDERASHDEPSDIAARAHRFARWSRTPLYLPSNGSASTRAQLTADYLKSLHERIFTRPAIVAIASQMSSEWLRSIETSLLHDRPSANVFRPAQRSLLAPEPRQVVVDAPSMDHAVVMRFGMGPNANDLSEIAHAKLFHEALCDGMSAPLMNELRGQQALSYTVSSALIDRGDLWDQLFEIEPEPKRVQEALDNARKLWGDDSLLMEEDFERARAQIATTERLNILDAGRALSTILREEILRGRPLGWRESLAEARENVDMHAAIKAAQSWGLSGDSLGTVIVAPAKKLPKALRSEAISVAEIFDPKEN